MPIVVPDAGEPELLANMIPSGGVVYHLFTNDYTPSESSTLASFTEATFNGYTAQTVNGIGGATPAFQTPVTDAGGVTYSQADADLTWTNNGAAAVTVYGYYVTTTGATPKLLWAERFGSPVTLEPGWSLSIRPRIELD